MSNNNFKVGDKVKIVKKVTERSDDFQNSWVDDMDVTIGQTVSINRIGRKGIYFNEVAYGYPPASLVKIGFDSLDEVVTYMKRGGYVVATRVCYRIKKGILEVNNKKLSYKWHESQYNISDIQKGRVTNVSDFTKRKYS